MKRKVYLILLALSLLLLPLTAARTLRTDLLKSPLKNIAYSGEYTDGIVNSAAFPFRTDGLSFYFASQVGETYFETPFKNNESLSGLQNLALNSLVSFGSSSLFLSGDIEFGLGNRNIINSELYFDINSYYQLQVDFAYRFDFFSMGVRLEGGNQSQRIQRKISSIADVFANMLFEKYTPVSNSEYFIAGASTFFKISDFNFTFTADELIKVVNMGKLVSSWQQIYESLSVGLSYESPKYKNDGNLQFVRFRTGLSFEHFLSAESPVNEFSTDVNLQLLPDLSIILGTSLRNYQSLSQLIPNFSMENTVQAIELKFKFFVGSLSFKVVMPISIYQKWEDNALSFNITGALYY